MKRPPFLPLLCLWFAAASAISAAPIQNLKFTDIVKDVKVLNIATKQETTAKVGDTLAPPNVIKTGADSRAELIAEDQTVTRVGANTIFSVDANSRDVNIAKGSVLFHSPAGKGGGNIKSAGATASVLGTTLIVGASQSGGFKVMLLEGKGQVTGAGGGASKLNAGQMSFAMPGKAPSQPLNFALKGQVSGSKLVGGFSKPLASIAKIEAAVAAQQSKLESGNLESTGLMIGDSPGTAFKLDSAVIRVTSEAVQEVKEEIKRVIIEQEKVEPKTEVPTRDKLDPRFLLAVRDSLNLTGNSTPDIFEQSIPVTLEQVTSAQFLANQKLGNYTEKNYGAPLSIPGNRESFGLMTLLVAQNFQFAIDSFENSPGFFLNAPFVEGKNFSGILAMQNIDVSKSVDFLDPTEYDESLVAIPKNFLLSAGRTITAESGTVMKANAAIFDVYTAGTGFSSVNSKSSFFTEVTAASKIPLTLENSMIWNDSDGGLLRIQAPEIKFTNQTLSADTIEIGASGPISLSVDPQTLGAVRGFKTQYDDKVGNRNNVHAAWLGTASDKLKMVSTAGWAPEALIYGAGIPSGTRILAVDSDKQEVTLSTEVTVKPNTVLSDKDPAVLNTILANARSGTSVPLPLGFEGPEALAIQAFKVSIRSTGKPISITGVPIHTNDLSIASGSVSKFIVEEDVSIEQGSASVKLTGIEGVSVGQSVTGDGIPSGTKVASVDPVTDTITLSEEVTTTGLVKVIVGSGSVADVDGSITLSSLALAPQQGVGGGSQSFAVNALGDLTITDSNFTYATSIDLRTNLNAKLMSTKFQDIEDLSVWADKDITFQAVSIEGEQMSANSKVSVTSNRGSVFLNTTKDAVAPLPRTNNSSVDPVVEEIIKAPVYTTRTIMVAQKVNFTANNGDIVINSYDFRAGGTGTQEFTAKAKNVLGVYNTSLMDAAKVSLAANTVVLRDVSFKGGADVALRSKTGLVAAAPGDGKPVAMGKVNFVSGVSYGGNLIHLPDMPTTGDAGFRDALQKKYPGQNFDTLTITDLNKQKK
jgi:hypothetical protein